MPSIKRGDIPPEPTEELFEMFQQYPILTVNESDLTIEDINEEFESVFTLSTELMAGEDFHEFLNEFLLGIIERKYLTKPLDSMIPGDSTVFSNLLMRWGIGEKKFVDVKCQLFDLTGETLFMVHLIPDDFEGKESFPIPRDLCK